MTNQQMELGFNGNNTTAATPRCPRRERRIPRATWWFSRMRTIVDNAIDWPAAEPRPEQTWIPGTHRQVQL